VNILGNSKCLWSRSIGFSFSGGGRGSRPAIEGAVEGCVLYGSANVRGLSLVAVSERYFMFGCKSEKIFPVYAVLTSRESEGDQVALFNPPQNGYFTHAAVPGYRSGGEILRVEIFQHRFQSNASLTEML
jgi:hypothetical protein